MRVDVAALLLVVAGACGGNGKDDDKATDDGSDASAQLRLHAFPNIVEPGGQATISVEVQASECSSASGCTVCLALPPVEGGGQLYPPAGIKASTGLSITLPISSSVLLQSITYRAPKHELSEVVSASCFSGTVDCSTGGALADLLGTTTERILIRKPSADTPTPPDDPDAGSGRDDGDAPVEMPSSDAG